MAPRKKRSPNHYSNAMGPLNITFLISFALIICNLTCFIGAFDTHPSRERETWLTNHELATHTQSALRQRENDILSMNTTVPSLENDSSSCIDMVTHTELTKCTEGYFNMNVTYHEDLAYFDSQQKICKMHVEESESKYNEVFQKLLLLEERYKHQEHIYNKTVSGYELRISKLMKEMHELKHLNEKSRDRYLESITTRTNLEKEIKDLRFSATRTYVNTTLIIEDCMRMASRRIDRILRSTHRFSRWLHPIVKRKQARLHFIYREYIRQWIHPWILFKKKHLRNFHGHVLSLLNSHWFSKKVFDALNNALEVLRLSIADIVNGIDLLVMGMLNLPYHADNNLLHPVFRENRIAMFLFCLHDNAYLIADYIIGFVIMRIFRRMFPMLWVYTFLLISLCAFSALIIAIFI